MMVKARTKRVHHAFFDFQPEHVSILCHVGMKPVCSERSSSTCAP